MGRRIKYRTFEEAREFARSVKLKNKEEWTRYAKGEIPGLTPKPQDIPSRVDKIYKSQGWAGFDDFLGTKRNKELRKSYLSFEQARAWSRKLNLSNQQDWQNYLKNEKNELPDDIPPNPDEIYLGKGWVSWADFLNDRYTPIVLESRNFQIARTYVRKLELKSIQEWETFRNGEMPDKGECPDDIPVWPPHAYKEKGWISWADWLGLEFGRVRV